MKITSIKKITTQPVYDITVKDAHHYILDNGVITHNSGLEYAASTIIFLSKKKDKDKSTNEVTGAILTAVLKKARLTIENKKVETLLDYTSGLDPYYGLLDLAVKFDLVKKVSTKFEFADGTKAFESAIHKNPEKYFTKELLDQIEERCADEFLYGKTNVTTIEENES